MLWSVAMASGVLAATQVVLVAILSAMRPPANVYKTLIGVSIVTAPLAFFADALLFGRALDLDGRIFLVLVHLALGGFFFHFMTLPDRSVTLRILAELELAPGHVLSIAALNRRYSVRHMIASRLQQLADGRFLVLAPDGTVTLAPRGVRFGRFVAGGRRVFRISSAN